MIGSTNPAIQQALDAGRIAAPTAQPAAAQKGEDFAQMLMDVMKDVNSSQLDSQKLQDDFITGRRPVEIHDVMIAMEKASSAMQLTLAVRNRLLDAYQEIEKLQV